MNRDEELSPGVAVPEQSAGPDEYSEKSPANDFLIVGIGASAGGFEALQIFLKNIPDDSGMAFVLVPHLDPTHETLMPELLSHVTKMPVRLVTDHTQVKPNQVYIISPNKTLTIEKDILRQSAPKEIRGLRLPIDTFFKSLADQQQHHAVAVILSGTGADGTVGIKNIKENGGAVFVQDLASAKYQGMPQSAILTGLVDYALPVEEIPERLVEYNKNREILQYAIGEGGFHSELMMFLDEICLLLRRRTGHDFSSYRKNTLMRRIQRQMQLEQLTSVEKYVELIRANEQKSNDLFRDLLIGVTYFFRNHKAFNALQELAITNLVRQAGPTASLRVWVPACATGEEAYTIAMLFCEQFEKEEKNLPLQIFATDIDEDALARARSGGYPESIAEQVAPYFLEKYFTKQGNVYQIKKRIRELCLFSPHNLIGHPPFSRLDLVSCRNLLIYLDSALQRRIIPMFHYALNPEGYLFLGSSESCGSYTDIFRALDKSHRIFQAKVTPAPTRLAFPLTNNNSIYDMAGNSRSSPRPFTRQPVELKQVVETLLLKTYAPSCVAVNERGEAAYFMGRTGKYFEPSTGTPSNNVLDMARPGLHLDLRTALHKAVTSGQEVTHENVTVETEGHLQKIRLIVRPLKEAGRDSNMYLIILEDIGVTVTASADEIAKTALPVQEAQFVRHLEDELRITQEHLQATIEELETSTEELKSSNEELLSMNEEMQSSNEEMQTSKEEMQSINEEMETVNSELRKKIEELDAVNSDLQNLFRSTSIATIFLDRKLRIKRFTPATNEIFRLIETDVGRPLSDIAPRFQDDDLTGEARAVLDTLKTVERQIQLTDESNAFIMRISPYRTVDNVIDGVVLTFVNISEVRAAKFQAEERARQQAAIAELGLFSIQNSDIQAICDKATQLTFDILQTDYTKILELLPEGRELLLVSGLGWHSGLVGTGRVSADMNAQAGYTLKHNSFVIVDDLQSETRFHGPALLLEHGVVSGMSVVIYGVNKPYGVFGVHTKTPRKFTRTEADFLQAAANIVAAAVIREESLSALRDSEARFRAMAETIPNLIYTISSEGHCDFINQSFADFLGLDRANLSSDELAQMVHPDDLEGTRQTWYEAVANKSSFVYNYRFRRFDSQYRWFIGRAKPILDEAENITKWVGSLTDIEDILQAQKAVEEADQRKNEFLAMLGHELRNPLAPVVNSLRILRQEPITAQGREVLEIIERQVGQMVRLVDDLLDVSRIAHGKIQLRTTTVNLNQLVRNLQQDFAGAVAINNLTLEASLPEYDTWITADETRMTQALGNLVGNSIKFAKPNGTISLRLFTENEHAVIKVTDDGIGMKAGGLDHIFESFSQEDRSLDRTRGGLGLGLPVAKGLIDLHGGIVSAYSAGENRGAEFTVKLPLAATARQPATETPAPAASPVNPQRRILVIEDNVDSAESLKLLLTLNDHEVEVAYDGTSGLSKAEAFLPEVIICDIGLPDGMDGYAVAEKIRKNDKLKQPFLIALSGYGRAEDLALSRNAGFSRHLTKPADFDELLKIMSELTQP